MLKIRIKKFSLYTLKIWLSIIVFGSLSVSVFALFSRDLNPYDTFFEIRLFFTFWGYYTLISATFTFPLWIIVNIITVVISFCTNKLKIAKIACFFTGIVFTFLPFAILYYKGDFDISSDARVLFLVMLLYSLTSIGSFWYYKFPTVVSNRLCHF
jgi:hypothetical protein